MTEAKRTSRAKASGAASRERLDHLGSVFWSDGALGDACEQHADRLGQLLQPTGPRLASFKRLGRLSAHRTEPSIASPTAAWFPSMLGGLGELVERDGDAAAERLKDDAAVLGKHQDLLGGAFGGAFGEPQIEVDVQVLKADGNVLVDHEGTPDVDFGSDGYAKVLELGAEAIGDAANGGVEAGGQCSGEDVPWNGQVAFAADRSVKGDIEAPLVLGSHHHMGVEWVARLVVRSGLIDDPGCRRLLVVEANKRALAVSDD